MVAERWGADKPEVLIEGDQAKVEGSVVKDVEGDAVALAKPFVPLTYHVARCQTQPEGRIGDHLERFMGHRQSATRARLFEAFGHPERIKGHTAFNRFHGQ